VEGGGDEEEEEDKDELFSVPELMHVVVCACVCVCVSCKDCESCWLEN
jgi:hypothetical protein